MQIKNLAKLHLGLPLSRKASKDENTPYVYKLFTLKNFESNNIYPNSKFFESFYSLQKIERQYLTKENDIVVRLRTPIKAIYIDKAHTNIVVPSTMAIITPQKIDSKLLTYFLNSKEAQKALKSKIEGTLIKMVGIKDLQEIEVPSHLFSKPQKLSSTLELIDKEIALLQELIAQKRALQEALLKG